MSDEQWRPVAGFEGSYEVSDQGRVRSLDRCCTGKNGRTRRRAGVILTPGINSWGYQIVVLVVRGESWTTSVHRLVATAFCEHPQGNNCVDHLNGKKTDNRACNLEWVTKAENERRAAHEQGLSPHMARNCKILSKPVCAESADGTFRITFPSMMEAQRCGFLQRNISQWCRTPNVEHAGFFWSYA